MIPMTNAKVDEFLHTYDKLADDGERLISFCIKYLDEGDANFDYKKYDHKGDLLEALECTEKAGIIPHLGGLIRSPADYFDAVGEEGREHEHWVAAEKWFNEHRNS